MTQAHRSRNVHLQDQPGGIHPAEGGEQESEAENAEHEKCYKGSEIFVAVAHCRAW